LINWPCILKHSNDAELVYISDRAEWRNETDFYCVEYDESDVLIDSSGMQFKLTTRENGYVEPDPNGEYMKLEEILGLIKAHAAQKGSCCVAKLYAPTISDAFKIVATLNEE